MKGRQEPVQWRHDAVFPAIGGEFTGERVVLRDDDFRARCRKHSSHRGGDVHVIDVRQQYVRLVLSQVSREWHYVVPRPSAVQVDHANTRWNLINQFSPHLMQHQLHRDAACVQFAYQRQALSLGTPAAEIIQVDRDAQRRVSAPVRCDLRSGRRPAMHAVRGARAWSFPEHPGCDRQRARPGA